MRPESSDSAARTELREMVVRLVHSSEQPRYQELMREHHYLGHLPKIGETLWYVASWREQWVALLSFSASALKCAGRDRWIGWSLRQQYARLKLVVNNSRFLILPDWHLFNLGSCVLSLCQRRLPRDWEAAFGHGVVLLETFVDPQRHRGTVYRAANWIYVGNTRGFRRTRLGYTATPASPKMVFLKLLRADARRLLCRAILSPPYHLGGTTMRLTAEQMRSLPCFFSQIPDPRRTQGRRHRLSTVLGIAAGAVLCGRSEEHTSELQSPDHLVCRLLLPLPPISTLFPYTTLFRSRLLCRAILSPPYHLGGTTMRLTAEQMRSLPCFFSQIPDPRRTQGRRHRLSTVLGIAAGAVLCGMRGYKAIADWAQSLGQKSRERFGCRREQGHYVVPSESILRNVLIRVTPADLDRALQCWNERYGAGDESLAIDGKTMCNALDEQGQRTHVMSVVGQQSKICYTQKKWAPCP